MAKQLRCPVCRKPLTKSEYERALGIMEAKEEHRKHAFDALKQRLAKAKNDAKLAKKAGADAERARTQRLLHGKEREIQQLKERVKQLRRGTTPQTDGLEFEEKLTERLRREFPSDKVVHAGKRGDVIHQVCFAEKVASVIIFECKRTPRIEAAHIRQVERAGREREADYAVLVTTGTRRGFTGLSRERDVLIVAPLGVIALVGLLRTYLLEIQKAQIKREKRSEVARRLLDYVNSAEFKRPLEQIVGSAQTLVNGLQEEIQEHFRGWQRRHEKYVTISFDANVLRENTQLVLRGKEPKREIQPPKSQLLLPRNTG
jgi:hypothetical protein